LLVRGFRPEVGKTKANCSAQQTLTQKIRDQEGGNEKLCDGRVPNGMGKLIVYSDRIRNLYISKGRNLKSHWVHTLEQQGMDKGRIVRGEEHGLEIEKDCNPSKKRKEDEKSYLRGVWLI